MASLLTQIFNYVKTGASRPGGAPRAASGSRPRFSLRDIFRYVGFGGARRPTYTAGAEIHIQTGRVFVWEDPSTWTHPHVPVISSNLQSVAYDSDHQLMQITFVRPGRNSGQTYNYVGVPVEVYYALMNAPSHGKYHYRYIRCEFSYSDLSGKSKLQGCVRSRYGRLRGPSSKRIYPGVKSLNRIYSYIPKTKKP